MSVSVKQQLLEFCHQFIVQRIANCQSAIDAANLAINEDTKSSAGDKYETSREMITQEIKNLSGQLAEAQQQKLMLGGISIDKTGIAVQPGSVVFTNQGNFFVSISAGGLEAGGEKFMAVSPLSPIGKMLLNKKPEDGFLFNGKNYEIQKVV